MTIEKMKKVVLEMTWKTQDLRNSCPSIPENKAGNVIPSKDSPIAAFGSSIQIDNSLIARVSHFFRDTKMMTSVETNKYLSKYGDYYNKFEKKFNQ